MPTASARSGTPRFGCGSCECARPYRIAQSLPRGSHSTPSAGRMHQSTSHSDIQYADYGTSSDAIRDGSDVTHANMQDPIARRNPTQGDGMQHRLRDEDTSQPRSPEINTPTMKPHRMRSWMKRRRWRWHAESPGSLASTWNPRPRRLRSRTRPAQLHQRRKRVPQRTKGCERRWLALSDRTIALRCSLGPDESLRSHIAGVEVDCLFTVEPDRRSRARGCDGC